MFGYKNCRSLNNKLEQLSDFLKKPDETSFLVVTETWINEKTYIPRFYLCNSHHFVHQPNSSLTNVQRGGGVGIRAPIQFTVKMRNDLNTINRSFFESMWIEIGKPLTQKLLINVEYCPIVNLSNFSLDEMTVDFSNVYSYTDNLILFGDYNIYLLGAKHRQSFDIFTANNGLCYVFETEATWTNGENYSIIDHCFISKNQIFEDLQFFTQFSEKKTEKNWRWLCKYFFSSTYQLQQNNRNLLKTGSFPTAK